MFFLASLNTVAFPIPEVMPVTKQVFVIIYITEIIVKLKLKLKIFNFIKQLEKEFKHLAIVLSTRTMGYGVIRTFGEKRIPIDIHFLNTTRI